MASIEYKPIDSALKLNPHNTALLSERLAYIQQKNSYQGSPSEDAVLESECDDRVTFRWLTRDDYSQGFPSVLTGLTKGCEYSKEEFLARFDQMFPLLSSMYKIIVIEDKATGKIIGAGTLVIE
mmetsp:Transcript_32181/g.49214  ORF Transcript_32181/g.49214 Transcript_32181/m.49214 type:complete len:124 (+) Transcript_32181:184-555(+)